jgi:hypothetical protein
MPFSRFKAWPFPRHAIDIGGLGAPAADQISLSLFLE